MQNLGQTLKRVGNSGALPLPNESACPECGYFDTTHPDVQRILRASGWTDERVALAQCRCRSAAEAKQAKDALRQQQANLPHPLHPRTFANFENRPGTEAGLAACKLFARGEGPTAVALTGQVGNGKSHLMEAVGRELLDKGRAARYEFVPTLIDRLRNCYQDDSEEDVAGLMDWYARFEVLLLDDIGAERRTPFGIEKLTEMVDTRLRQERRLLLTTNYDREDLTTRVGPRLASRIHQGNPTLGDMMVVPVTATDYRR